MNKVAWGVHSTGRIAHQFAQDIAHVKHTSIAGAYSRTKRNAQSFAREYDVPTVYDSYAQMLEDPTINAVYIASPHTLHLQNVVDAVRAGKAVLCEKPLVTSVSECQHLIDQTRDTSGYVMEAMWTYFLPAIRKAMSWFEEGRIGQLVHIKADFGYPQRPYSPERREYDASLAGGAALEMGIYPVALAWLFLKRQPDSIQLLSKHAPNGVEDDVSALFDYGDCVATLGTSFRTKLQNWAYIIGENGYIAIPDFWRATSCHLYELDTCVASFDDGRTTLGLNYETQSVVDDLLAGRRESPVMPLSASLAFQTTLENLRAPRPG